MNKSLTIFPSLFVAIILSAGVSFPLSASADTGATSLVATGTITVAVPIARIATSSPISIISPAHPIAPIFSVGTDLSYGMTSPDVMLLQAYLNSQGFTVASTGPGSSGQETTYFGNATREALASFQAAKGIVPASGYFGPITRAYIQHAMAINTAGGQAVHVIYQGQYVCLPHVDTTAVNVLSMDIPSANTLDCAFGLETSGGLYYALDFTNAPNIDMTTTETGVQIQVTGTLESATTSVATLEAEYNIQGVIMVNRVSRLDVLPASTVQ